MGVLQEVQKLSIKRVANVQPGYTVRVHQKIKEGEKERVQIFEGLVIKTNSGYGADKTFTVRKIVQGIGVEKVFPLYSPLIEKIEVKKKSKIRRAKLFYMRNRSGKSARLKASFVSDKDMEDEIIEENEEVVEETQNAEEAPQAEETKEADTAADTPKEDEKPAEEAKEEKAEKKEEAPVKEEKVVEKKEEPAEEKAE